MLLKDIIESKEIEVKAQLKGTDRARTIRPNISSGSQPHPFRGKLVGETPNFKNTYEVGDRVNTPLGNGTITAVSKNINIDGKVKVKLDDPSQAGEDGKYKDSFIFQTIMLKHINENLAGKQDPRTTDNFTIDDIKQLEKMSDLEDIKKKAIELISASSQRPMKPEKVSWLKKAVINKKHPSDVVKLMYDLLLGGEGMKVIGATHSYRRRFGEETNPTDMITMDIPLFLRMLEYAKEDAKTDMDLHDVTERAIEAMKQHEQLSMDNYNELVGKEQSVNEEKKGLYYYVNKRKKAGTSRPKSHPKAPSEQDWKNAAKTAKKA